MAMDTKQQAALLQVFKHDIRVKSVRIEGLRRVKDDVVLPHLTPLLKQRNLYTLLGHVTKTFEDLDKLDAFDNIDIAIEHMGKNDRDINEVSLKVAVSESRRHTYGINVSSDRELNDGTFTTYAKLRNLFGRLESLQFDYIKGTKISDGCNLVFNKPLLSRPNSCFKVIAAKENMLNKTSGYLTSDVKTSLLYQLNLLGGQNEVEVGALWQQIHGGSKVNVKIREEFGHHLKCAVRHRYLRDTRNDKLVATSGARHMLETELAGYLGDVNHLKLNLESQLNRRVLLGYSAALNLRAGYIHEMGEGRSRITDRYFTGGPGSIRGFFSDGIGRPVGATAHWGAGLSLTRRLPFCPHIWGLGQFMRVHHFVNAGSVGDSRQELLANPRVSVGSGVIIKVGNAMKMEINYAVPLRYQSEDVVNHGLQFGIGVNFM